MRLVTGLSILLLCALGCSKGDSGGGEECGAQKPCPEGYLCDPISRRCIVTGGGGPDAAVAVSMTLSLSITGGGAIMVSGAPNACSTSPCSYMFTAGEQVTLTAAPLPGGRFVSWSGACSGTEPAVTVKMDAARSCTATFAERFNVTGVVVGATGAVTARSTDGGASCSGAACAVDRGGSVSLTAPTIEGFRFTGWGGAGCSGSTPFLMITNVTDNVTCAATYTQGLAVLATVVGVNNVVSATSSSPGAVCQAGGCTLSPGGQVTLTAPTIEGYRFSGWSGDPECVGSAATLVLENIVHSISCTAGYVQRYTVSGTVSGAMGVVKARSTDATATCEVSSCVVDARGKVTLEAPVIDGFRFSGWGGGCFGTDNPVLLANINASVSCSASYVKRVVVTGLVTGGPTTPVMAMSGDPGAVCMGASCTVDVQGGVSLLAPTAAGFRFAGWSGGAGCSGAANPLVLMAVADSVTCKASYLPRATVTGLVSGGPGAVTASSTDVNADCSAGTACTIDTPGNVTLKAPNPPSNYVFRGWLGGGVCNSTKSTLELKNVKESVTCTARFAQRVTVMVSVSGATAEVTVSSNSATADCSVTECTVDAGEIVTLKVVGADFLRFVGWDGEPCVTLGLAKETDLALTKDGSCAATFVDARSTARPSALTRWLNPTGWLDENMKKIQMTLRTVNGARYECRTGRTAVTGPTNYANQPWAPCDGESGLTPLAYGLPVQGEPNGSYRTEVRLAIVAYRSDALIYEYYAHDSLNGVHVCPEEISDSEVQTIANQLQLATTFQFSDADVTANPFVKVTITGGFFNYHAWPGTPVLPSPYTLSLLSLRHRFTLLPKSTLPNRYLVVRRQYASLRQKQYRNVTSCGNSYEFGWKWASVGGAVVDGNPQQERLHCGALLMNAQGFGYCLYRAPTGAVASRAFSYTTWEKLLQKESFSRKTRQPCTGAKCPLYLPD